MSEPVVRRKTKVAGAVDVAWQAGEVERAEWEEKFIDFHREDVVRILDLSHAGQRISECGNMVFEEGTPDG